MTECENHPMKPLLKPISPCKRLGKTMVAVLLPLGLAAVQQPQALAEETSTLTTQGQVSAALPDFTTLAQENGAAVVNISSTHKVKAETPEMFFQGIPGFPEDSPYNEFFKRFFGPQWPGPSGTFKTQSLGSGFIISPDGYILTNAHVIDDADKIIVKLSDKRELPAKVVGSDKLSDVALLKINATKLPTESIGDSSHLQVGQWVLAIGSPFGLDHTATQGIISAVGRSLPGDTYVPFIQTDVPLNPGNSGGPLLNLSGKVIGINSQIYTRTGGYMGLSFAIPINVAMNVVHQLQTQGHVSHGWLGVTIQDVNPDLARSFGLENPSGALIAGVVADSPAQKAGLKTGDVIVAFGDKPITDSADLPPLVGTTKPGVTVPVTVIRNGKRETLKVEIKELPEKVSSMLSSAESETQGETRLNIVVSDLTPQQRKQLQVASGGVLVQAVEPGIAADAGIRPGDVILSVNSVDIADVAELKGLIAKLPQGKTVPVLIKRSEGELFLALKVPSAD
jgi:serine protease Do